MKKTLLASLLALGFVGSANAAPIVASLTNTFNITTSGQSIGPFVEKAAPPADWYGLQINGAGTTSIIFDVSAFIPPAPTTPTIQFRLYKDLDGVLDSTALVDSDLPNVMKYWNVVGAGNTNTLSLSAGVYAFIVLLDPTPDGQSGGTVASVPVPAAAWLFGSALFGAGALRRKQKTA